MHVNNVRVPEEWAYVTYSHNNVYLYDLDLNILALTEFDEGKFPIIKKIKWKNKNSSSLFNLLLYKLYLYW